MTALDFSAEILSNAFAGPLSLLGLAPNFEVSRY